MIPWFDSIDLRYAICDMRYAICENEIQFPISHIHIGLIGRLIEVDFWLAQDVCILQMVLQSFVVQQFKPVLSSDSQQK